MSNTRTDGNSGTIACDLNTDAKQQIHGLLQFELNPKRSQQKLHHFDKNEFITSAHIAGNKIVELSKKLRERNAEIESLKSRHSKLECELNEMRSQQQPAQKEEKTFENVAPEEDVLKRLQETNQILKTKLAESRNSNLQLKNDLKLANKWLQQEIGDSFECMQALNKTEGNWRGRAQIISELQTKYAELREKFKCLQNKSKSNHEIIIESKLNSTLANNKTLKDEYTEMRRKYDAQTGRYKVLQSDYAAGKVKFDMLAKQYDESQDLVTTLTVDKWIKREKSHLTAILFQNQLTANRSTCHDIVKQKDHFINKLREDNERLELVISQLECKLENLDKELRLRDSLIEELDKNRIVSPSDKNSDETNNKFIELITEQNARLELQRKTTEKMRNQLKIERQKRTKLESTVARLEVEHNSTRSSYCLAKEPIKSESNYKDQLEVAEEQIKALQTRLQIEQHERKVDMKHFAEILHSQHGE